MGQWTVDSDCEWAENLLTPPMNWSDIKKEKCVIQFLWVFIVAFHCHTISRCDVMMSFFHSFVGRRWYSIARIFWIFPYCLSGDVIFSQFVKFPCCLCITSNPFSFVVVIVWCQQTEMGGLSWHLAKGGKVEIRVVAVLCHRQRKRSRKNHVADNWRVKHISADREVDDRVVVDIFGCLRVSQMWREEKKSQKPVFRLSHYFTWRACAYRQTLRLHGSRSCNNDA